ncbi:MAG: alpha/beta hydrolase family protein [Kiritimatiellales bacterium]
MNNFKRHAVPVFALVFAAVMGMTKTGAAFLFATAGDAPSEYGYIYAQNFANNSGESQYVDVYGWHAYSQTNAADITSKNSKRIIAYINGKTPVKNVAALSPFGDETTTTGVYVGNTWQVSLAYVPLPIDMSTQPNIILGCDLRMATNCSIARFAFQAGDTWYVSEDTYNYTHATEYKTARIGLFGDAEFRELVFVPGTSLQLSPEPAVPFSSITGNISNVGFYLNPNTGTTAVYMRLDNYTVESVETAAVTSEIAPSQIEESNYVPVEEVFIPRAQFEEQFAVYAGKLRGTGAARVTPEMTVLSTENLDGYVRQLVAYNVEENERITGWLLIPAGLAVGEKRPLMMCIHGTSAYGKDAPVNNYSNYPTEDVTEIEKRNQRKFGEDLVKRGFICFAPDRPGYGERVLPGATGTTIEKANAYKADFAARYPTWSYEYGKVVHDLQQALDFLVELDFVNTNRIGSMGHSLGGHDSLDIAAMDERIKAIAHSCGGGFVYDSKLWTSPATVENAVAKMNLGQSARRNLFHQKIAPRGVLLMIGLNDPSSPLGILPALELITEYYKEQLPMYGLTRQHPFTVLAHTAGHAMPDYIREYAYDWLEKQLMEY